VAITLPFELNAYPFAGMGAEVRSLAFRPKDQELATLVDKQLLVWDVNANSWRETACRLANRNLTRDEWSKFLASSVAYHGAFHRKGIEFGRQYQGHVPADVARE